MADVLSARALNRALLARQLLLKREAFSVAKVLEHVVGLQAQTPQSPYVSMWSRVKDFKPLSLSKLLEQRKAVRLPLMRSTLHCVTAKDALRLRGPMGAALERTLETGSPFARQTKAIDRPKLLRTAREFFEEKPRSLAELRAWLQPQYPSYDAHSIGYVCHYLLPLVQLPPRGLWKQSGAAICTTLEHFLGQPLGEDLSPDAAVLRYLRAFGPAAPADFTVWSRLPNARAIFERLNKKLRVFRDANGRELFDVTDGELPDEDTPAPVRFLPDYDNVFLSHDDRERIVAKADPKPKVTSSFSPMLFTVDGFLAGVWKLKAGTLELKPWRKLSKAQQRELEDEGERLVRFLEGDDAQLDVRVQLAS